MEGEGEREEKITMEELGERIRAVAIIAYYERLFGKMPHPLRFFKFRRWMRDFKIFLEGVKFGEKLMRDKLRAMQNAKMKRTIEVMEENE